MLTCQRDKFAFDSATHYLNCAYQAPLMHTVVETGQSALLRRQKPHLDTPDIFFDPQEQLKRAFATLVGIADHERIAIIPSVSYGMANVASNVDLKPGDNVVITGEQFSSNVYPWMEQCKHTGAELRIVSRPDNERDWTETLIGVIDQKTRVVTMGNVHWTDGTVFDLVKIARHARAHGALVVIDGTQSVGAMPLDFAAIQPDALICSGYKWLLGPYSLGLGYYGPWFDDKRPIENNWITRTDSDQFQHLVHYRDTYRPKAYRYTVGEPSNFVLLPMLLRSIRQLIEWQPSSIQEYCTGLADPFIPVWRAMGYQLPSEEQRCAHLFGVRIPDGSSAEMIEPILKKHRVFVSFRGHALRISLHLWNTEEDLRALTHVLEEIRQLHAPS